LRGIGAVSKALTSIHKKFSKQRGTQKFLSTQSMCKGPQMVLYEPTVDAKRNKADETGHI
jgi:hypothetical protein